ncbi:Protein kinase domain-containing protein [Mycena venus]|uniref:Protein kinase domain-containing protein n=1 Tax=Mycena venus TaxID=2733690 RepID=A0A8H7DID5_9AGAR|nr:Protein kinase domain-containing protein [Mycena venus]
MILNGGNEKQKAYTGDNIAGVVSSTGEHIIDTLSGGAFKKVMDEELQGIWRAQGWKGNVKARNFAPALNYFYVEKFTVRAESGDVAGSDISDAGSDSESTPATRKDDRWALACIGVPYLNEIAEAVDDDGAGFINIHEANGFAHRRPEGWSLVSWVAYFAAGWHTSVTWYKNRIYNIVYAMVSVAKRAKSANVQAVNSYLSGLELQRLELLLRSTGSTDRPVVDGTPLRRLTDEYQIEEAAKFEDRLKTLNYELDEVATIQLITKKRRVEHYVYPLLYQLLKRHFDILRLACIHVLEDSEFTIMSTSLASVFQAVDARKKNLKVIFKSHSLDVEERLEKFAFGMFQPASDDHPRVPRDNTIRTFVEDDAFKFRYEDLGPESDDAEEKAKGIIASIDPKILRYHTKKPGDGAESDKCDRV